MIDALRLRGYRVVGPTIRDQAIVYDDLVSISDLPRGWTDEQDGGRHRLVRRDDEAIFGYAVGPHSRKKFLHPPVQRLWRAERQADGVCMVPDPVAAERFAFIGVRACELHAIAIEDRVLLGGQHIDPHYQARRDGVFLVAVNCGTAGGTCFCVSMNTGPKADAGFDLALTEILVERRPLFVVEAGSDAGRAVLAESHPRKRAALRTGTMEIEGLERIVREHPFLAGLEEGFGRLVCGCAKNVRFETGQYLFHEGGPADQFYLLRHGRVALQITSPGRGAMTFRPSARVRSTKPLPTTSRRGVARQFAVKSPEALEKRTRTSPCPGTAIPNGGAADCATFSSTGDLGIAAVTNGERPPTSRRVKAGSGACAGADWKMKRRWLPKNAAIRFPGPLPG